jgi:4-hydroxybenzoate polyprenyltransferase
MLLKKIKALISLVRVRQWYKNLLVFLALIFVGKLFSWTYLVINIMAFVSLCLISSSYYIINDLKDIKRDRIHPEKCHRPLAAGIFSKWQAVILFLTFFISALVIAWQINREFFYVVLILFLVCQIYTFFLKGIVFADILTVSTMFVIRAIAGALAISVYISPWLILCPFFLAMFMVIGKRRSDLFLLKSKDKEENIKEKGIITDYSFELTSSLMNISTAMLILSYALYCFLSNQENLMFTLPFALFVIFQYHGLVINNSVIARQPEKIFKSKRLLIGIALWLIITFILLYV